MIINPSSLQKYGYPNDTVMSLVEAADSFAELFHEGSKAVYLSYQEDSEAWIICDNYDRGMFNAIKCYDNGRFTIWDVDEFKEYSYVSKFNGYSVTSYDAAYQHAKQFFRNNSTRNLKGKEITYD